MGTAARKLGWISACLVLCRVADAHASCAGGREAGDDQDRSLPHCFLREGINISIQAWSLQASAEAQGDPFVGTLLAPDDICQAPGKFKRALLCAMNLSRGCLPASSQGFLPADDSLLQALDAICRRKNDIDFECFKSKTRDLFDCGVRKASQMLHARMSAGEIICQSFELRAVCQKEVLPPCGCITTKLHVEMGLDLLYPPACPGLEPQPRRVVCNPTDALAFLDDGLGGGGGTSAAGSLRGNLLLLSMIASRYVV